MAADDVIGNIIQDKHYQPILSNLETLSRHPALDQTQRDGVEKVLEYARGHPVRSEADIAYIMDSTRSLKLPKSVGWESAFAGTIAFEAINIELGATAKSEADLAQHRKFYIETVIDRIVQEIGASEAPAKDKEAATKNVERLRPTSPISQAQAQETYTIAQSLYRRADKNSAYNSIGNEVDFLKMVAEHADPSKILPYQPGAAAESAGKINRFLSYFEDPQREINPETIPADLKDDFGPFFTILLKRQEREQKIDKELSGVRKRAKKYLEESKAVKRTTPEQLAEKAAKFDDLSAYVTELSGVYLDENGKPVAEDTFADSYSTPAYRYRDDKRHAHPANQLRKALHTIVESYTKFLDTARRRIEALNQERAQLGGIKQEQLDEVIGKNTKLEERIAELEAQLENESAWRSAEAERAIAAEERADDLKTELIAYTAEYTVKQTDHDAALAERDKKVRGLEKGKTTLQSQLDAANAQTREFGQQLRDAQSKP